MDTNTVSPALDVTTLTFLPKHGLEMAIEFFSIHLTMINVPIKQ